MGWLPIREISIVADKTIHLRVDVDFNIGLERGVPFLLDLFSKKNIQATFFVVMGPDTLYRHQTRVKSKTYQKRLRSFNIFKLAAYFGPAYLKSRFLHPRVGPDYPRILEKIVEHGHELGIHGFDHAEWADRCFEFDRLETERHMQLAIAQFQKLFPGKKWIWGAPNWMANGFMLEYLEKYFIPYSSDVRGCFPFYPHSGGKKSAVVQFPINLPCLHELAQVGIPKDKIPGIFPKFLAHRYNLWCIHDYYEGLLERKLFLNVVDRLQEQCYRFKPINHAYENLDSFQPGESKIEKVKVPGGIFEVSCQNEFLSTNYFATLAKFQQVETANK